MAGEVRCRLQAPGLLRCPVLKKIHSCHKPVLSVCKARQAHGRARGGGSAADTKRKELSLLSNSSHSREAGHSRNGQTQLGFKGPWCGSPGTSSHALGSEPGRTGPCVRTQPFCQLGIPVLIWVESVKGSAEGGEVTVDLHFRQ